MNLANDPVFLDSNVKDRIMRAIDADLAKRGYETGDWFIEQDAAGKFRIYYAVVKLPRDEFLSKYAPEALESMSPTTEEALIVCLKNN